ncbi:MAG: ADP-ribosylglycohydrolase family protein [Nocardioidaceae bacterium]|nr:ADP-ribosylglycohydrolase family protein [Nocardioidaceae bacterium]
MTDALMDRAAGTLLGTAVGDALGVPYEFATPLEAGQRPEMIGGGLGDFAPGEWSDDTAMTVAVARAVAAGADLTAASGCDLVAAGFLSWFDGGPADIGNQTRAVLGAVRRRAAGTEAAGGQAMGGLLAQEARVFAVDHPHAAGNGALMRTTPVALWRPDDREATAVAARVVASLTHADPVAGDSCILWTEAVRVALTERQFVATAGLDLVPGARRDWWRALLDDALTDTSSGVPGRRFSPNGWTVTALQAAVVAVAAGLRSEAPLEEGLCHAVRIGDDTDTVAAIAGGLLGALHGAASIPAAWADRVHGWPGLTGPDLVALGRACLSAGQAGAADL